MVESASGLRNASAREKAVALAAQPDADPLPAKYHPSGPCGADTLLLVHKQNATGKEPTIRLWFDPGSTQFIAQPTHRAQPMVAFSAIPEQMTA